jgi:hypothetical protein
MVKRRLEVADTTERRLTVLDCVVMVTAITLSIAAVRLHSDWLLRGASVAGTGNQKTWELLRLLLQSTTLFCSWAVTGLWLWPPRPSWRELGRRPGFITGVAVLVQIAFQALWWLDMIFTPRRWLHLPPSIAQARSDLLLCGDPRHMAPLIAVGWATLALSGGWSPDRSWLDRLGRGLGVFWIGWACGEHVLRWLES